MAITVQHLLLCTPTADVQLVLLALWALLWFFAMPLMAVHLFKPLIDRKKWKAHFVDLFRNSLKQSFFIEFPSFDAAYSFSCLFLGILVQHAVGGAFCLPAMFPSHFRSLGVSDSLAAALACQGALCEGGWELQDITLRAYQTLSTKDGWAKNPPPLVILLSIHHILGLTMIVPMNLHAPTLAPYHELVFLLQFAAFVAMSVQMYGYTLDVTKRSELWQMRLAVVFALLVIAYSRLLRFLALGCSMLFHFSATGEMRMLVGGSVGLCCMLFMNALIINDNIGKCLKFLSMPLPTNETERKLVRQATSDLLGALSEVGNPASFRCELTAGRVAWAKLRGVQAVRSSVIKKAE